MKNRLIRFMFGGKIHELGFSRAHRTVNKRVAGSKDPMFVAVRSMHPYTTAKLRVVEREGIRETCYNEWISSVGCLPGDKFEKEVGRKMALRKMMSMIQSKDLRQAIWSAYIMRQTRLPEPSPPTPIPAVAKLTLVKGASVTTEAVAEPVYGTSRWYEKHPPVTPMTIH